MNDDLLIDAAALHFFYNEEPRIPAARRSALKDLYLVLQSNGLTVREILAEDEPVSEATEIRRSDLTDEGWAVVKASYHRWMTSQDRGAAPDNTKIMQKALAAIREASS